MREVDRDEMGIEGSVEGSLQCVPEKELIGAVLDRAIRDWKDLEGRPYRTVFLELLSFFWSDDPKNDPFVDYCDAMGNGDGEWLVEKIRNYCIKSLPLYEETCGIKASNDREDYKPARPSRGKVCPRCREYKTPWDFYWTRSSSAANGWTLSSCCRPCHKIRTYKYVKKANLKSKKIAQRKRKAAKKKKSNSRTA